MQKVSILIPSVSGREGKLKNCLDKILENTKYQPIEVRVMLLDNKDYVYKILSMAAKIDGLLVYLADDVEVQKDWLSIAVDNYNRAFPDGDGLLCFNDGMQSGRIAAHGLTSGIFLRQYFHDGYKHFYVDQEFSEKAKKLGLYIYCEESLVTHVHPGAGAATDRVYKENYKVLDQDKQLYEERND